MLNLQERKQIHKEFMCAALNGILANHSTQGAVIDEVSKVSCDMASAALLAFEERWKGEEE